MIELPRINLPQPGAHREWRAWAEAHTVELDQFELAVRTALELVGKKKEVIDARDFAKGNNSADDTEGLQRWADACEAVGAEGYWPKGIWRVRESSPGSGYALKFGSFSWRGEFATVLAPLVGMPNTADFIKFQPLAGSNDAIIWQGLLIYPDIDGTKRGRHGIYSYFDYATSVSRLRWGHIYVRPSNDVGISLTNVAATNPTGVLALSEFDNIKAMEGMRLLYVGDSLNVHKFRADNTGTRHGLHLVPINGADGAASVVKITEPNIVSNGGAAILVEDGRNIIVTAPNIEHHSGAGSNGAVVDFNGGVGKVYNPVVDGGLILVAGTSTCTRGVRFGQTIGGEVKGAQIRKGNTSIVIGVDVTSGAEALTVGKNHIDPSIATDVLDSGVSTRGTKRTIALSAPLGGAAEVTKSDKGVVTLDFRMTASSNPNNVSPGTLPVGFRPTSYTVIQGTGDAGGTKAPVFLEVTAAGVMTLRVANAGTGELYFQGQFITENSIRTVFT